MAPSPSVSEGLTADSLTVVKTITSFGQIEELRYFLKGGADAQWRTSDGDSAIENACSRGHLSTVEILLHHDKDLLEMKCNFEMTPLLVAINSGRFEIARFLLDCGANALATTDEDMTALMLACLHEVADLTFVRRLLAAGVGLEARNAIQGTALHVAAKAGRTTTMRELILEHDANMFVEDSYEYTPFNMAADSTEPAETRAFLIECYGIKLTQKHG